MFDLNLLYRGPARDGRRDRGRARPLHLCGGRPLLFLPPDHASQGGGLRAADFGDCSGGHLMALHFERTEFDARRDRLMIEMAEKKLDAILLFAQESMYWLTGYDTFGFCFFQSLVVKSDGSMVLLTRSADLRQARHTSIIENIVLWTDREGANPARRPAQPAQRSRPARRPHRRRIRHARPDRLQRPPARRATADVRPDLRRLRHRRPPAPVQEPGRDQEGRKGRRPCRRCARRGTPADQAGRRRGRHPRRHAGRDLCRRRRLSGQRVHHRLRRRRAALPLQGRPPQARPRTTS